MNLQICFMNEAAADADSPSSDSESCPKLSQPPTAVRYNSAQANPYSSRPLSMKKSQSSEKGQNWVPCVIPFLCSPGLLINLNSNFDDIIFSATEQSDAKHSAN